ncbi:MAG: outer membrane protein assembly factor BamE [Gammaproteobacteria bacterium]|nr:outer membrane protein assembly factor BamE [Gammaproteobacteria bacterium]
MPLRLLTVLILSLLTGCNILYKPEIQQGNPLSPEAIAGLRAGMTKRQVRLLLGTPTLNDVFHPDRWDYLHTLGRSGEPIDPPPVLTLHFRNDSLVRAEGKLAPAALKAPGSVPTVDGNGAAPKNGTVTPR